MVVMLTNNLKNAKNKKLAIGYYNHSLYQLFIVTFYYPDSECMSDDFQKFQDRIQQKISNLRGIQLWNIFTWNMLLTLIMDLSIEQKQWPSRQIKVKSQQNNIRAMSQDIALMLFFLLSMAICQLGRQWLTKVTLNI